jgi:pimeloyl-ACP methyl ester carboxylesterase
MKLERHWVCADGARFVHISRLGKGPPVVLLHGSPQSARALNSLMYACAAQGLTVIAPDTPGNGLSDPLSKPDAAIEDYADALQATLAQLGVPRAAFYGFHTGAAIAASLAARHPQAVSALVLDGCPIWTETEREDLLAHYLPAFQPLWDGGHLTWVWARLEEQSLFFPWHQTTSAGSMPLGAVSSPEHINANAIDFLRAGDAYRTPYAAAFRFVAQPVLASIQAPFWLTASPNDPLHSHIARAPSSPHAICARSQATRETMNHEIALYLSRHADASPPQAWSMTKDKHEQYRGFIDLGDGVVSYRGAIGPEPKVFLHDAGSSAARAPAQMFAIDLPGHGPSGDSWKKAPQTPADCADALKPVLHSLLGKNYEATGHGLGAAIAHNLGGPSTPIESATPPPDLTPRWDGAHLVAAWRYLRRRALFTHWDRPDPAHRKPQEPQLDPAQLNAELIDLLDCAPRLPQAFALRAMSKSASTQSADKD